MIDHGTYGRYNYWKCRCFKCKAAMRKNFRTHRKKSMELDPDYYKKRSLRERYGITLKVKKMMATQQRHRCAICRRKVELVIDHDHKTKKVRGLLCNSCNRALGIFPTIKRLQAAMRYLK